MVIDFGPKRVAGLNKILLYNNDIYVWWSSHYSVVSTENNCMPQNLFSSCWLESADWWTGPFMYVILVVLKAASVV